MTLNDRDRSKWELYDLSEDRSETNNLIHSHPDIAQNLKDKWLDWAKNVNILPFPEERELIKHHRISEIKEK